MHFSLDNQKIKTNKYRFVETMTVGSNHKYRLSLKPFIFCNFIIFRVFPSNKNFWCVRTEELDKEGKSLRIQK